MDGLRLALIVVGIALVAVVYFWSARRRRLEREAGDFDRFDAWTDERLDPLADAPVERIPGKIGDEPIAGLGAAASEEVTGDVGAGSRIGSSFGTAVDESAEPAAAREAPDANDPNVLQGLEAIAESLDTRVAPAIGAVERIGAEMESAGDDVADNAPPTEPAEPELVVVINVMAPVGQTFNGPPLRDALENAGLRAGDLQLYHYLAEGQPPAAQPIFSALNMVKPGTLAPEAFEGMRTPGVALVLRLPGPERPREAFELMHGTATGIAEELGGRLCDDTRSTLTGQALSHLRERIAELARRQRLGG